MIKLYLSTGSTLYRALLLILFSNGKQNRKSGSVGEFWDLEEKVANPQKVLEVGRLSEGRA